MLDFDNVRPLAAAEIVSRDSKLKLEVSHDLPALLGEWYPIRVIFENKEDHRITGVSADVNLQTSGDEHNIEQASKLSNQPTNKPNQTKQNQTQPNPTTYLDQSPS
jgi:hypothetical protein